MTENSGWPSAATTEATVETQTFPVLYPGQPATEEPEAYRIRRNAEIQRWLESKHTFVNAQTEERDWRAKVSTTLFPTPSKGTQRYDLGGGYKVKLVYALSYSIGNKDQVDDEGVKVSIRNQVQKLEDEIAALGEAHTVRFEAVVSWKPEVSGSNYEKLATAAKEGDAVALAVRERIDKLLTIKPGSPQLEFEEPRAES